MKKFKDIKLSATDEFLEQIKWMLKNKSAVHFSDLINEVVDNNVPVTNHELVDLLQDDINFALDTPEIGPAFDGSPTAINIIAANVYEKLSNFMYEWADDQKLEEKFPKIWLV